MRKDCGLTGNCRHFSQFNVNMTTWHYMTTISHFQLVVVMTEIIANIRRPWITVSESRHASTTEWDGICTIDYKWEITSYDQFGETQPANQSPHIDQLTCSEWSPQPATNTQPHPYPKMLVASEWKMVLLDLKCSWTCVIMYIIYGQRNRMWSKKTGENATLKNKL